MSKLRNQPCACGSGKKTKRCCGDEPRQARAPEEAPVMVDAHPGPGDPPLAEAIFERAVKQAARGPVSLAVDERLWWDFGDAPAERAVELGMRVFRLALAEDVRKGRLPWAAGEAGQGGGSDHQGNWAVNAGLPFSCAIDQGSQAVATLQRRGWPRLSNELIDAMTAEDPRLLALYARWAAWARAENALLMDEPMAELMSELALPDEDGLRDLVQLATGALYRDTYAELEGPLTQCLAGIDPSTRASGSARSAEEVRRLETELIAVHALLVEARVWKTVERSAPNVPRSDAAPRAGHPSPGAASCVRTTLAGIDPLLLTRRLARDLVHLHGWPAGRALLAAHELRRAVRPGEEGGMHRAIIADEWPDTPLCDDPHAAPLLPTLRGVMASLECDPTEELAGQYRGAALALALPAWLDLLLAHGLAETDHDRALEQYTTLLTGYDGWTMVWEYYYDPLVLEHLDSGWCKFVAPPRQRAREAN